MYCTELSMLKKIFVLYFSQIYRVFFPLLFVPLLISFLGSEKYGLIAFFFMLQGFLGLLDAGISGTFIKLISTNKNSAISFRLVINLFIKTLIIFTIIASIIVVVFFFKSGFIAHTWLNTSINSNEVSDCIKLIGVILALIYLRSYLSSFLNGMERQGLFAVWSMVYTTLFYGFSYYILSNYNSSLYGFFTIILAIALLDFVVVLVMVTLVAIKHYSQLQKARNDAAEEATGTTLSEIIKFSMQLSGLSMIWVVASQIDKLSLSAYTELSEYGHYQVASQLSAFIAALTLPLSQFLLPRLSVLYKENKIDDFIKMFNITSLSFVFILIPILPYFFIYGGDIISLWLKNKDLGEIVNNYAKWLASSAFISAVMNFVFIYLYAKNKLRGHFFAYALYSTLTIPLSIIVAKYYGAEMSAKFVFAHTLLFMLSWGGYCIKSSLTGYISAFIAISIGTLCLSTVIFIELSKIIWLQQNQYLGVLAPPVINFVICGLIMRLVWPYFKRMLDRTSMLN